MTNGFVPQYGTNYGANRQAILSQPSVNIPYAPVPYGEPIRTVQNNLIPINSVSTPPFVPITSTPAATTSGGFNIGDVTGLAKLGGGTGIRSAVDQFGFDVFGIGNNVPLPYTGPAPFATGIQDGLGTQIGAAFNPANIIGGIGGNLLADAFGLGSGNQYVDMATSTVGGLIGQAAIPIPGVGAAVGSFLGSAIGGIFSGNKPSDKTMAGGVNIGTGKVNPYYAQQESSTGDKYSKGAANLRDQVTSGASAYTQFLLNNGATPIVPVEGKQREIVFVTGERDGLRFFTYNRGSNDRNDPGSRIPVNQHENFKNFGNDYQAYSRGIVDQINQMYNIPPELQAKLDQMDVNDIANFGKSTAGSGSSATFSRPTMYLPERKESGKETFDQFLTRYREEYNARAIG